jgi:hypothetical protein
MIGGMQMRPKSLDLQDLLVILGIDQVILPPWWPWQLPVLMTQMPPPLQPPLPRVMMMFWIPPPMPQLPIPPPTVHVHPSEDRYRIGILLLSSKGRLGVDLTPEDNDVATIEPAANAMLLFQPPPQIILSSSLTWTLSIIVMDVIAFVHAK